MTKYVGIELSIIGGSKWESLDSSVVGIVEVVGDDSRVGERILEGELEGKTVMGS
jgi:hypothetical protein